MFKFSTVALMVSAAALAGCKMTGGGFIPTAEWNAALYEAKSNSPKAHFGFNAECTNVGEPGSSFALEMASGNLQFSDNGSFNAAGDTVRLHGKIDGTTDLNFFVFDVCQQPNEAGPFGIYSGTYDAQPKKLGSGEFTVVFEDGGEPGPSSGDAFAIEISTGPFAGYVNSGFIGGGNIQYHF